MYLRIKRNNGESIEQFEYRKVKIKRMLECIHTNFDEFTGPIDVIASSEAEFRLNYKLEEKGVQFKDKASYDKALKELTCNIGDSDILNSDGIGTSLYWFLNSEEMENELIKVDGEWSNPYGSK